MATTAPQLQPDHHEPPEHPTLVPDPLESSRQASESYPLDPTQGRKIGSDPYDDATQGRKTGADPADDPTQGQKIGSAPYDDTTQGQRIGSDPYDDPAPKKLVAKFVANSAEMTQYQRISVDQEPS